MLIRDCSMGGSVVVHVAEQKMLSVRGVAVLDVVEGANLVTELDQGLNERLTCAFFKTRHRYRVAPIYGQNP